MVEWSDGEKLGIPKANEGVTYNDSKAGKPQQVRWYQWLNTVDTAPPHSPGCSNYNHIL